MTITNIAATFEKLKKAGVDLNTIRFITDESGKQWVAHLIAEPVTVSIPKRPGRQFKLSEADRQAIVRLAQKATYKEVGDKFGVVASTVCNIVHKDRAAKKAQKDLDDKKPKEVPFTFKLPVGHPKLQKKGQAVAK